MTKVSIGYWAPVPLTSICSPWEFFREAKSLFR